MINLLKEGTVNTIAISPISRSLYFDLDSGSFELELIQDYDRSSGSLILNKLGPVPTQYYSNYLLFSVASSDIPAYSGFYTYNLKEGITGVPIVWETATQVWGTATETWSVGGVSSKRTIDTGRAKVVGTDQPSYIRYVDTDQDGQYVTYHQ